MTPERSTRAVREDTAAARSFRPRWLTGLEWRGVALVIALCLINGLRRSMDATSVVGWLIIMAQRLGTGLVVMLPVTFAIVAAYNLTSARPMARLPALVLAVAIASAAGTLALLGIETQGRFDFEDEGGTAWAFVGTWPRYALLGLLLAAVFVHVRAAEDSEAASQRAELDSARLAGQEDEARLQTLQAQIEPHFLFNTLANVRRLYQTDAAAGSSMLGHLMRYLEVALPQMRASASTLGREAALAESYLAIQRIRMGRRLSFEIDVPEALRGAPMPPMMLVTLAENAIKHGVNPLPEGGFVRVSARAEGGLLRLRVADTGQGFTRSSGAGTGLANTRARLAAIFGTAAGLALAINSPRGVTATITIPWAPTNPGAGIA
jgi:signal transduction histidine kinase